VTAAAEPLPADLASAHARIIAERAARLAAETKLAGACAEAANAQADLTSTEALIAQLKLAIEKLRRELYGSRSERKARLLDQMELELEEIEAAAREDELAAREVSTEAVAAFERKRPSRRPFPAHLPRERVVIAAPQTCPCCGSTKLSKLGEDITETLEVIPRQWKVVQTVRERFSCRDCETITQPPAPFHVTPRGFAGPNLLATILFEKFGQHQPLNRQSERYAREGIELSVSTLADQVGACTAILQPAASAHRVPCIGCRAPARRRHHRADPGQGQDGDRAHLDLCPGRPALRQPGPAGRPLLCLAEPQR
jgi:transposase